MFAFADKQRQTAVTVTFSSNLLLLFAGQSYDITGLGG